MYIMFQTSVVIAFAYIVKDNNCADILREINAYSI